jgi:hypothetical protein
MSEDFRGVAGKETRGIALPCRIRKHAGRQAAWPGPGVIGLLRAVR